MTRLNPPMESYTWICRDGIEFRLSIWSESKRQDGVIQQDIELRSFYGGINFPDDELLTTSRGRYKTIEYIRESEIHRIIDWIDDTEYQKLKNWIITCLTPLVERRVIKINNIKNKLNTNL